MRHFYGVLIAFILCLPLSLRAQQSGDDAAADSLVRSDEDLYEKLDSYTNIDTAAEDPAPHRHTPSSWRPEFAPIYDRVDFIGLQERGVIIKYDRADGFYLGAGGDLPSRFLRDRRIQGHFGFGYAFSSHYWQARGGVARDFGPVLEPLRFSLEGHIITDTRDAWKMSSGENSLFALLAGIDTRDYYKRNGVSVGLQKFLSPRTTVGVEYRWDNFRNSQREANWSLFGPHHPFRDVPSVREGGINSVVVSVNSDYMTLRSWKDPQFGFGVQEEVGFGSYNFQQLVADARAKITVADDFLWIAARARYGNSTGDAPPQKYFTLGGFGTLEGYPQNEYTGSRMMLVQTDVLINPLPGFARSGRLIFSNNVGAVGLDALPSPSQFLYSTGVYLGSPAGRFRIGVAWRTDISAKPTFVMKVAQPF